MKEFPVELFPEPVEIALFGHAFRVSQTVLTTWGILAAVLALALVYRFALAPRLKDNPKGPQQALEAAVEGLDSYVGSKLHGMGDSFGAYIFSLALLLVASAFVELLDIRAPTTDITMTLALGLITFFLVNYYGFKRRGLRGRMKAFRNPFLVLSDMVAPISMACRLFGNMFGGMIIIELLYYAMGNFAVALPSVAGLYFNVFHPLIQAFIFITLTLSYIAEASETEN
ncbi:MAG: F0F1 ATP synthase subunit A [Oscillospiraceae bacterium]|nr:F0F1 ATP synthase subunit A [Oscillospiraceae bacterium]